MLAGHISEAWHLPARSASYEIVPGKSEDTEVLTDASKVGMDMWEENYFSEVAPGATPSVRIKSVERPIPHELCGAVWVVACATIGSDTAYPHFAKGRDLFVAFPPFSNTEWVAFEHMLIDPAVHKYLPETMAHELGHVVGLGHLPAHSEAIMRAKYDEINVYKEPTSHDRVGFNSVTGGPLG